MTKKKKKLELTEQQVLESFRNEQAKVEALRKAHQSLSAALGEIIATRESLKELNRLKRGEKVFVSLGAGVFFQAAVEDTSRVRQTIGSNVVASQGSEAAAKKLGQAQEEHEKKIAGIREEIEKTSANLENLARLIMQAQQLRGLKSQL